MGIIIFELVASEIITVTKKAGVVVIVKSRLNDFILEQHQKKDHQMYGLLTRFPEQNLTCVIIVGTNCLNSR